MKILLLAEMNFYWLWCLGSSWLMRPTTWSPACQTDVITDTKFTLFSLLPVYSWILPVVFTSWHFLPMKFNTFERTVIITCFPPDVFPPVVWSSEISLVKTYFSCLVMPPTEFDRRWDAFDFFFSAWPPPVKDVAAADPPKCRQVENISPSFLDPLKRWEVVTVLCELKIQVTTYIAEKMVRGLTSVKTVVSAKGVVACT